MAQVHDKPRSARLALHPGYVLMLRPVPPHSPHEGAGRTATLHPQARGMKRYVVTGGAGFLGAEVVQALAERGDEVVAFDVAVSERLADLVGRHEAVSAVTGELTEWHHVAALLQRFQPHGIVHCAAIVGVPASVANPLRTMQVNVEGTLHVLEAMRLFEVPRLVHISSEEVYGPFQGAAAHEEDTPRPLHAYGVSKLAVEHLGRGYRERHGVECINLRTCWVYGPRLPRPRIPKTLLDAALAGRELHLERGGDFAVDHTHVSDAVQGVLAALDKAEHPYDVYNIGSGTAPTLSEIVAIISELVPGARISVGPGNYLHGGEVPAVPKGALDLSRAREVLGYAPRFDIRRGLADYIEQARGA